MAWPQGAWHEQTRFPPASGPLAEERDLEGSCREGHHAVLPLSPLECCRGREELGRR